MKKQLIATVAVATLGLGSAVSAEETVKPVEEPKPTETTTVEDKTVTESDVKQSEQDLVKSQEAVNAQKVVVAEVETEKAKYESAVTDGEKALAEAEALAKEASPEAIAKTQESIVETEKALVESDKAISSAEADVTKASSAVEAQETLVASVQADLAEKNEAVKVAQADVDKAQAILDGTNQSSVVAEAEEADKALETAKTNLATAEAELIKAKESDQKRAQAIAEWAGKVETANADLTAKEGALSTATAKVDETGTALSKAQQTLTEAENKVNAINTITVSPEYVQALNDYVNHYLEKGDEAKALLDSMADGLRAKHSFKANPADEGVVLDTNNLSEDVLLDLSNFASDLINQIRKAFGKPETVVTPSAIRLADLVTDGYVTDDWKWEDLKKGHDLTAIASAARELGLKADNNYYENLHSYNTSQNSLTLSDAKERIYNSLVSFMFNGWEYFHAESIAGHLNEGVTYLGVDFSSRSNTTGVHFLMVDDSHILDASKFDKTVLDNPYDSEAIRQAYKTAQTAYAVAKGADDKAKSEQALAQESYNTAQIVLSEAKQSLAEIEAQAVLTPNAQAKRDKTKALEVTAKERHVTAQEALANLSADVKVKQANLVKAKEVLVVKTADKTKVAEQLATEQAKLSSLKTVVNGKKELFLKAKSAKADLQEKLANQTTHLERLNNAPKVLETAKSEVAKAQEQLAKAVAKFEKEVNILKELEAKQVEASEQHAKIVAAYQTVLEAKRLAELERQKEEIEKSGVKPLPVLNNKGEVVAYVADNKTSSVKTSTNSSQPTLAKTRSTVKVNTLPKTNDSSNLFGLVGLLLSGFGLVGFKRKYK